MTSTTYFLTQADSLLARLSAGAKSFGAKFVAAREAQAKRIVNGHLAMMDDETLARLGVSREEVDRAPKAFYPD